MPTFHCRQPDSDLVARLRFLFVRPCAARSPAQVTWTRGRGHPTVPGARWRSPLALTSGHPPPIHPFVFEAVAPRKLVSQLREITFSGPLASFVGKNFDTRQDACWGQLRDEAVCSPQQGTHKTDRRRKGMVVGSTRRESAHRLTSATLLKDTSERHLRLRTASEDDGLWSDSVSSLDSDFSLSGHVPLARPPK